MCPWPVFTCLRSNGPHRLPKSQRNLHIQNCVRRDMATRLARLVSDIHYCYHCFDWIVGDDWEEHCQTHLDALTAKRCGSVTHCHTLVRPAYCPICIGAVSLSPSERLKPWSRDHKLWIHVNEDHMIGCQWPLVCLHPLCKSAHQDDAAFRFHLMDAHKFSRSRPATSNQKLSLGEGTNGAQPCRKRKFAGVEWQQPQSPDSMAINLQERSSDRPLKRHLSNPPASPPLSICPSVILIDDDVSNDDAAQTAAAFGAFSPPIPVGIEDDGMRPDLQWGLLPSSRTTAHDTAPSLEQTDLDDGSDLDAVFKQYLRSPSSSPPPPASPDAGSELSGGTLIIAGHDQPIDDSSLHVDSLGKTISDDVPVNHVARDPVDAGRVGTGPCIRLRVNQPKITLRLRLHGTSQPEKKKKKGRAAKRKTDKKSGARKGNPEKTGNKLSRKR